MGYTPSSLPYIGLVPYPEPDPKHNHDQNQQQKSHYILAGFNGGGMSMIFLSAKGVAEMVLEGKAFAETGIPRVFETSVERLEREGMGASRDLHL